MTPGFVALSLLLGSQTPQIDEGDYYRVDYLTPPEGVVMEVGGMDFLPDGRLVVSTRRGQVWMVENPLAENPAAASFQLFADGLQEGLGLTVVGEEIYLVQRGELSQLIDRDRDGTVDRIRTLTNAWGLSGNYHEFAFGLPRDSQGNFYVSLNVAFISPKWWHGKSPVPYRGWVLQIDPRGNTVPYASGFRSPCGLGVNAAGDLFVTDNQGDWMPVCPIYHLQAGRFYGHPASLNWTAEYQASLTTASDTIPVGRERAPAALWLPYKWSRSTGNLVFDNTAGKFGPFTDQLFVAELTNGMVLRAQLEKVRGEYQGAAFVFRQRIGSNCRVRFAPDGTLMTGFTNRGWGGLPPSHGLGRIRWTGKLPMEMKSVRLISTGFEIEFTKPLDIQPVVKNVLVQQYDYDYWWEYGSPERHTKEVGVEDMTVSEDRRKLILHTPALKAGMMARVILAGVRAQDSTPLLHNEFAYAVNQLPHGPLNESHIVKIVPPPPARQSGEEGWLRLTWADATDAWHSQGWQLCDAEVDPESPEQFAISPGNGALVNQGVGDPYHFVSKYEMQDQEVTLDFMLPKGGNSGVYLQGRYEVQLFDSGSQSELKYSDCGGLYRGAHWPGRPPEFDAFLGPGLWHKLRVTFEAPRFDEQGRKTRNARFVKVLINDTLLHSDVEVPEATASALLAEEAPWGPLMLQGNHGPVAFRDVRVKALNRKHETDGWAPLFNDEDLEGWKISDDGKWRVEDYAIVGSGARSHIFSPRGDYRNFELRARVKISDGGNSGIYFRTQYGSGWPAGYEAQINSNYADPQKNGSLYGLAPVTVQLVPPDTWFDYHIRCQDVAAGTLITLSINGIRVTEYVDTQKRHTSGHIAFQQHHEGSVVELMDIQIRELE